MKKTIGDWEQVGVIGVDAGLCWLGDPCYVLHKEKNAKDEHDRKPKDIGDNWMSFCDKVDGDATQFKYDLGHAGLGVCVSTGYGDGTYPVEVKRSPDGRIAEVRVVFISEDDGLPED